jgi:uncharacterized protein (UPF0276 family)
VNNQFLTKPQAHTFGLEWAHPIEQEMVQNLDRLSCVEIIAENFFHDRFANFLAAVKKNGTPVAVHGVLLSVGSMEPLREDHLKKMLDVGSRVNMVNFSEHLSMTQVGGVDLDALTPLAWNEEVADLISRKIERIQSKLKVSFLIENVSNRFVVPDSDYSETEFINRILDNTGCGLLLDVTNVYTNSVNFKFDPYEWLGQINMEAVQLVHLAGGYYDPDGFLMDSHDNRVSSEAWDLYRHVCARTGAFMTIIERTGNFPQFAELSAELDRARNIVSSAHRTDMGRPAFAQVDPPSSKELPR